MALSIADDEPVHLTVQHQGSCHDVPPSREDDHFLVGKFLSPMDVADLDSNAEVARLFVHQAVK